VEKVTCASKSVGMLPVRRNQLYKKKLLFKKETSKLPIVTRRGQGKTTEESDVKGSKFKKVTFL